MSLITPCVLGCGSALIDCMCTIHSTLLLLWKFPSLLMLVTLLQLIQSVMKTILNRLCGQIRACFIVTKRYTQCSWIRFRLGRTQRPSSRCWNYYSRVPSGRSNLVKSTSQPLWCRWILTHCIKYGWVAYNFDIKSSVSTIHSYIHSLGLSGISNCWKLKVGRGRTTCIWYLIVNKREKFCQGWKCVTFFILIFNQAMLIDWLGHANNSYGRRWLTNYWKGGQWILK